MCLTIKKGEEIKKAEEDITCYKLLYETQSGCYLSICREYPYKLGQTYKMVGELSVRYEDGIYEGIHGVTVKTVDHDTNRISGGRGWVFHVIVLCIIPKGSMYCLGTDNEIVADTMTLKEVVYDTGQRRL